MFILYQISEDKFTTIFLLDFAYEILSIFLPPIFYLSLSNYHTPLQFNPRTTTKGMKATPNHKY